MKHEELIKTPEYWTTKIQLELFEKVEQYMEDNRINRTELAKRLGVSKGYISQVLNGDFDYRISKLVELALFIGYYPHITFEKQDEEEVLNLFWQSDMCKRLQSNGYVGMFYKKNLETSRELTEEVEFSELGSSTDKVA
ncbi:MAG: helix-turn-helix domain-containing protein [Tannerellaceae bacterium]|nr:helix-turn-helix domain-containing protein [Tannerellaceae bacterium]